MGGGGGEGHLVRACDKNGGLAKKHVNMQGSVCSRPRAHCPVQSLSCTEWEDQQHKQPLCTAANTDVRYSDHKS